MSCTLSQHIAFLVMGQGKGLLDAVAAFGGGGGGGLGWMETSTAAAGTFVHGDGGVIPRCGRVPAAKAWGAGRSPGHQGSGDGRHHLVGGAAAAPWRTERE